MEQVNGSNLDSQSQSERINLAFGLMLLIWYVGPTVHFMSQFIPMLKWLSPVFEWLALAIYVLGSIGVVLWRGRSKGEWAEMYLAGGDRGKSLKWGGIAGGILFVMDIFNTVMWYKSGKPPMMDMQGILVNMHFLYLFPVLVLAEEFLWRGLMLSAMIQKGINSHIAVFLTTTFYALNHFAVAPVGLKERGLMAMMAFPIGILGGYIALKSKNVWGSVLVHMITMFSMILDIFVIPNLVYSYMH